MLYLPYFPELSTYEVNLASVLVQSSIEKAKNRGVKTNKQTKRFHIP